MLEIKGPLVKAETQERDIRVERKQQTKGAYHVEKFLLPNAPLTLTATIFFAAFSASQHRAARARNLIQTATFLARSSFSGSPEHT